MDLDSRVCEEPMSTIYSKGIFNGDDPLDFPLPVLLLQLILFLLTSQAIYFLLRPLRQTKFVCDVLGGIILGPTVLGRNSAISNKIFPPKGMMSINTIATIGSMYFVFIMAVKIDKARILRTAKKAWHMGITVFMVPFLTSVCLFHWLHSYIPGIAGGSFVFFFSSDLSLSYFAVIFHVLGELNLLNSELGQLALSCAVLHDVIGWVFVVLTSIKQAGGVTIQITQAQLSMCGLVLLSVFVLRPAIRWIIKTTPEGKPVKQIYLSAILLGPLVMGCLSDALGSYIGLGVLMMGLIIPAGPPLGSIIVEKLDVMFSNFFLPFLYLRLGQLTDLCAITNWKAFTALQTIITASYSGKSLGTFLALMCFRTSVRNAALLSLIFNIKGVTDFLFLLRWRTEGMIKDQPMSILVISHVIVTAIVTPLLKRYYKPQLKLQSMDSIEICMRTLQTTPPNFELRILCCVHNENNVHSIITLLKASNTSTISPLCAYVVHLVELEGRATPLLAPYNTQKRRLKANPTDRIMRAIDKYSKTCRIPITIESYTMVAPYNTMHETICDLARDKFIPLIILPFHEREDCQGISANVRTFNLNVQEYAPCTVGIFVDRVLPRHLNPYHLSYNVAVFFLGGSDDREALRLVSRMSNHPDVSITLLRIDHLADTEENLSERHLDDNLIAEFLCKNIGNACVAGNVTVAENTVQVVDAIRRAETNYDLVVVGKNRIAGSQLEKEMMPWVEHEELGVIGDMIASPDFCGGRTSVLVIQCFGNVGRDLAVSMTYPDERSHFSFSSSNSHKQLVPR